MAYLKHLLNKWIIYINKLRLASTLDFLTVHRIWHMKFGNLTQVWIWIFQTEIRKKNKTRKWKQMGKWVIRSATPLHQTHFPHSLTFSPGTYLHSSWPAWSHLFFFLLCTYLHPASAWRWLVEPLQQIPLLSELVTEREMCPWVISKYFGDWVPTQVFKCESMSMDEQSANQEQRYVSKS
jgi:hypothetical protein